MCTYVNILLKFCKYLYFDIQEYQNLLHVSKLWQFRISLQTICLKKKSNKIPQEKIFPIFFVVKGSENG
jgi:hypothetical protein